jgi:hypothetical protein
MKTILLVVLLVLSLAGNAAWYFQRPASDTAAAVASPNKSVAASAGAGAARVDVATIEEAARIAKVWTSLQNTDLKTMVERLRAAGFPLSMIRALVAAQIQEQFSARRKALLAQQEDKPFWKSQQAYFLDPKTMSGLRDLGREQSNLLKQLLGPDGVPGSDEALAYQHRQFGDLPRDKREQLQSIVADYGDLRNQVYATANGVILPEDREKLAILEKEQRADFAAILTPQELENYDLRSSSTANALRSQLALFNPTEDEFRAIFKLQQAFDDKYGAANMITGAEQYRQRQMQQQELTDQIKSVLSPDRVDAYKQSVDPAYQMVNRLVARLDLPASAATEVVAVQQDINKRAAAVRSDRSLAPEVRNMQLTALAQEAGSRLTNAIGARGFEAYKQYGGQWVQNLTPRPPPASP